MGSTGYLSLMNDKGLLRSDLCVQNDDLKAKIAEALEKQDDDNIAVCSVLSSRDSYSTEINQTNPSLLIYRINKYE